MRRMLVLAASVAVGFFAVLPPVAAEDLGSPPAIGGPDGGNEAGFFGFQHLTTVAQGQVATGYFFAIGDEVNRLVGAHSEIDGPPVNSREIAAFVQRGIGATYVYGVAGGPGGTSGALPDPPPGEAPGYFPTDPHETTFSGPVTAVLNGGEARTVDGRFHAKAEEGASGTAEASVTRMDVPGYFGINQAVVTSHGRPVAEGVEAESVSVLQGLTVGPLHIDSLTSRAYGFVPSLPGDPKGVATTLVEGATVGKTPVMVTDQGIVVADKGDPTAAQKVRAALTQAGLSDVKLLPSLAAPSENKQQISAQTGGLQVIHRDPKFGASNPQGFQGGGFALGGAEVTVVGQQCDPACSSPAGAGQTPGVSLEPPTPADNQSQSATPFPSHSSAGSAALGEASAFGVPGPPGGVVSDGPTVTFTRDATPEVPATAPVESQRPLVVARGVASPGRPPALRAALAAVNAMGLHDADELTRMFLAMAGAMVVVIVATRGLNRGSRRRRGGER
ncbi:MAG: hypothetical protein QOI86_1007 [Actinomycetota bacterium]|nr:hypothetical protein [Actinomycetota bacterium]